MDKVILSIFRVFNPNVSRISKELREVLNPELVGDWFLSKDHSLIIVFGFTGLYPTLLVFLTLSIFSLEVMRQRIHVDIEHFIASQFE